MRREQIQISPIKTKLHEQSMQPFKSLLIIGGKLYIVREKKLRMNDVFIDRVQNEVVDEK